MRWLNRSANRADRGASTVTVAILILALLGFVALGVDLGAAFVDRTQQQNGADAAALGIAQECAAERMSCSSGVGAEHTALAQQLAVGNKVDGNAVATVTELTRTVLGGTVTVRVDSTRQNWFAGVIGIPTSDISASATAVWSGVGGTQGLPLAFSWCAFEAQTGGWDASSGIPDSTDEIIVYMSKSVEKLSDAEDDDDLDDAASCTPPSGLEVPGGFGWLPPDSDAECSTTIKSDWTVESDTGNNVPCPTLEGLGDTTVVIPIFDSVEGTGSGAIYHIVGMAAFHITAFKLGNPDEYKYNCAAGPECNGSLRWIKGYFTEFVAVEDVTPPPADGGTDFGVRTVRLTA